MLITQGVVTRSHFDNSSGIILYDLSIPLFSSSDDEFPPELGNVPALTFPGMILSYSKDEKVYVGFADNNYAEPILLGKIPEGTTGSKAVNPISTEVDGSVSATFDNMTITKSMTIPANTQLSIETNPGDAQVEQNYKSINDIINRLNDIELALARTGININEILAQAQTDMLTPEIEPLQQGG